ncbi:MAG: hypothetical protein KTR35_03840 [Gammaproteobacteria bacterium]|nr:hypothetical protein [Gammaproteobacteria bacterium]
MLLSSSRSHSPTRWLSVFVISAVLLSGCSSSDDSVGESDGTDSGSDGGMDGGTDGGSTDGSTDGTGGSSSFAFVSAATPTFDAGQIERFTLGETIAAAGAYPATLSDITVRTNGSDVFQVGRLDLESITRYTTEELTTPVYQYSVLNEETAPNTYDIVFASATKAYVLQYESSNILIVNPSASSEAEFITGSIDISAYDEDAPNATSGVIANGKLFVLLQRLTGFNPVNPGYVAVFDVETDAEISTGMNSEGLNGIALTSLNPDTLQYVASSNDILVNGRGNINVVFNELPGDPYMGGVEIIDADSYVRDLLVDDGTETDNDGFFFASIQAGDTRGYVITSVGYQDNTLRSYNVATGLLEDGAVAGLESMDLTGLAIGPSGNLWVGIGGIEPGYLRINPEDNSLVGEKVDTEFVPNHIVFVDGGS